MVYKSFHLILFKEKQLLNIKLKHFAKKKKKKKKKKKNLKKKKKKKKKITNKYKFTNNIFIMYHIYIYIYIKAIIHKIYGFIFKSLLFGKI